MSRNKAENCRNEVKSHITREGMTMTEVVELLADEHGWSSSVPNLSGKLRRGSLRYTEAVELADVLGYRTVLSYDPAHQGPGIFMYGCQSGITHYCSTDKRKIQDKFRKMGNPIKRTLSPNYGSVVPFTDVCGIFFIRSTSMDIRQQPLMRQITGPS